MLKLLLTVSLFILSLSTQYPYYCKSSDRAVSKCIEEYAGVCGYYDGGGYKTYSTVCEACKSKNVEHVNYGSCGSSGGRVDAFLEVNVKVFN
jgi:hypothetical protein